MHVFLLKKMRAKKEGVLCGLNFTDSISTTQEMNVIFKFNIFYETNQHNVNPMEQKIDLNPINYNKRVEKSL